MIDKQTGEIIEEDVQNLHTPFLRTPYNYDRDNASIQTGLYCTDLSLAKQEFREEADINTIVERFGLTGEMPQNLQVPIQADFIETTSFQEAMNTIKAAEQAFMQLPANIRAEFKNDPAALVDFVSNKDNREAAEKMGLVINKNPPPPAPTSAPAGTPPQGGGVT